MARRLGRANASEIGKLTASVLPLGVDTFVIAAAVGASGLGPAARRRITAVFVAFEAGMPLVGLTLGAPLVRVIGHGAEYLAAMVLIGVGAWMLFGEDEEGEEERARSFTTECVVGVLGASGSPSFPDLRQRAVGCGGSAPAFRGRRINIL